MDASAFFVHELTRHQRALCTYICALTGHLGDAEEVQQEVNARLWEQKDAYDQARPFLPWARTIAHDQVLAFRTRKRRERFDFNSQLSEILAVGKKEDQVRNLNGAIDELAVFGRALTPGELAALYDSGRPQ